MHEREKSDPAIGAGKPTNKAEATSVVDAAEPVEQRAGAKGNASEQSTHRTQGRERVSQALERVRKAARLRKKEKFTALLHHINIDLLREAFFALKRDAAPGVDGVTWRTYEADLDLNLTDLASRVHRGAYRALPSRRTYIPKADGRQRPLGGGRPGRQNRPEGDRRRAELHLRGGLPRVQLRVPAGARTARCAGRALRRDHQQEGELHFRRGHSILFRRS